MLRHHKKPSTLDFRCIGEQMCDGLVRVSSLHLDNLLATTAGGFGGAVFWDGEYFIFLYFIYVYMYHIYHIYHI